jgi:putative flippase GtrA
VRLLRKIPEHRRKVVRELVTFGLVGGVNTIFGFAVFNLLFDMGSLTANAISTAAATVISFILNRHVTYRDRMRTPLRRELPMFAAFNLVGLCIQQAVMALAKIGLDLHETARLEFNLVRVVSVGLGTVFLLLSYRTLVFKRHPDLLAAPSATLLAAGVAEMVVPAAGDASVRAAVARVPSPAVPVSGPPLGDTDGYDGPDDPFTEELTGDLALDGLLDDGAVRSTL